MKKYIAAMLVICLTCLPSLVRAATYEEAVTSFERVSLAEVRTKIRQKESFYLFIGRSDNRDAQLAAEQLLEAKKVTGKSIVYLDTKGIDAKAYKSFSRTYAIKSMSYLAYFAARKQQAVYHNNWQADASELTDFLSAER